MAAEPTVSSSKLAIPANGAALFLQARDFLLQNRSNYEAAYANFAWPKLDNFNWALDYFDSMAAGNSQPALIVISEDSPDQRLSFTEMSQRSNQVANFFRQLGIGRGERILAMLGNQIALWETMLAASKIGAVVIPTSTIISADELRDRFERGNVRHVIATFSCRDKFDSLAGNRTLLLVGGTAKGWIEYERAYLQPDEFTRGEASNGT